MAELTNEVRIFIVVAHARMMSPQEIVEAVAEEFEGLTVSRQQVRHYNPEQSAEVAAEWRDLHAAQRERFLSHVQSIPIANKAVRLRLLQAGAETARSMGNWAMVSKLCEQAAKEEGGMFTNRREITGAGGGAVAVETVPIVTDYRQTSAPLAPPPDAQQIPLPLPELGEDEAIQDEAQVLEDDLENAEPDDAGAAIDGADGD